jgi:hypothetical protein
MYQLFAAAFGVAAGGFAWSGDAVLGFLFALCAVVWLAVIPARRSFPSVRSSLRALPKVE